MGTNLAVQGIVNRKVYCAGKIWGSGLHPLFGDMPHQFWIFTRWRRIVRVLGLGHIAEAEGKAEIQPDGVADDLAGRTVAGVGVRCSVHARDDAW